MYRFLTFGATLLTYTVAAFALYQRTDSPLITIPAAEPPSAPQGFNMSVSFQCLIYLVLIKLFPPAQAFLIMETAALLDHSTTTWVVHFQVFYPHHNAFTLTTSGDQTSINVFLSKYFVEAGPGIPISCNRALCQLRFGVKWGLGFFSSWFITDQALQCCLASLLVSLTSSQVLTM